MDITVKRETSSTLCTIGQLFINGMHCLFTLEPPLVAPAGEHIAIPAGCYPVWLRWSDTHRMWVPAIMDVPGRSDIEIHPGNYPRDTKGCLLVGTMAGVNKIDNSEIGYSSLMGAIIDRLPTERVLINIVNPQPPMVDHA